MNILVTLFMLGAFFTQNGYGIKCYNCNSGQDPNNCTNPAEETCSFPNDRCSITNATMQQSMPGGSVMTINMQIRGCALLMQCNEDSKQQMCQSMNSSGTLKSCEYNCCQGDLCNDGVGPYPPLPTKPPALDLSCHECSPEGMGPNGTGQALISCKTPRERKCGDYAPGYPFDRCMTVKMKVKNPKTGALLEQETKNCSLSSMMCSNNMICQNANSTGDVFGCEVKCCSGNLCNSDQQKSTSSPNTNTSTTATPTTTTPAGPTAGQTPLAISSIIAIMSAVIALLF